MTTDPLRFPARDGPRGRLPPHDAAAEEAVLAALLLSDGTAAIVEPLLDPADFFREHNGWCYEAALALAARNERITITTLAHELERAERLELATGGTPTRPVQAAEDADPFEHPPTGCPA